MVSAGPIHDAKNKVSLGEKSSTLERSMGESNSFICPACGLAGHVSGGEDAGECRLTTTIYCQACCELHDVPTSDIRLGKREKVVPRCPRRKSHPIRLWNLEELCPRCGKALLELDEDGYSTLWD